MMTVSVLLNFHYSPAYVCISSTTVGHWKVPQSICSIREGVLESAASRVGHIFK